MLLGTKQTFAIECYHDPFPNAAKRVFGRMCVWVNGAPLGDIEEPACMLNVTEGHLSGVIARLEVLSDNTLDELDDQALFNFLDQALYLDDDRTTEEVQNDADKYFKFDFLTNGGESFDRTKSFVVSSGSNIRLLFSDCKAQFHSALVSQELFVKTITSFFKWIKNEEQNVG